MRRRPPCAAVAIVFAAGIALRFVFLWDYRPAFLGITDAGSYIDAAHRGLFRDVYDPAGYPLFIRGVHALYSHLTLLIGVQHALGVAAAALWYRVVRGVTGSKWLALIPAAVVLFDGYELWVEHAPLSETLFTFLVAASLCLAVQASEGPWWAPTGVGIALAATGLVRPVALVLIPLVALWILSNRTRARRARAVGLVALVGPASLVLGVYVLIQRADTGFTGITRDSGRLLYARAAAFAECSEFTPPAGTIALCEHTPSSRRGSFNQYVTGFPDHATGVSEAGRTISPAWRVFGPPPAGDGQLAAFGRTAILNQPLDYIAAVAKDFHYYWADHHRAFIAAAARVDPLVERTVTSYYRTGAGTHSDGLGFLRWYGETIEVNGALMIVLLIAPLAALLARDGRPRRVAVLFACTGWLLPLVSDAVASVDPRYILPSYGPLAAAAAIGSAGLRFPLPIRRSPRRVSRTSRAGRGRHAHADQSQTARR